LHYSFVADAGVLVPRDNTASLGAFNVPAGPITIMATVLDDRDLSASAATKIVVEIPPTPPVASSAGAIAFKPSSAYVDNRAKAMLDGISLRLQKEPGSAVTVIGGYTGAEKDVIANTRSTNAKSYLTKEKGIDVTRVNTSFGGYSGDKAEVIFIPAGAVSLVINPVPAPPKPPAPKMKPMVKKPAAKPVAKPVSPAPAAKPAAAPAKPGAATPATTTPAKPGAATPAKPSTTTTPPSA